MAEPTRWQLALREAQVPVTDALKRLGFRKSGNHYNRVVADQLVQVVGFQSGQAVSIFHGKFTVNLGVYVPCVAELEGNAAKNDRRVTDAHCEIRSRLSEAAGLGEDRWWPLDKSAASTGKLIADALLRHGVPFLDRYASHDAIIERFESDGSLPFNNPGRNMLAIAIAQWARGETEEARRWFESARKYPSHNGHFSEYVASMQSRCGI